MKIMTYNILEGGIDNKGSRIEHIIDVIKKANPEFVAIQEANNLDKNENELLKKISNKTKLPYYALSRGTLYGEQKRYHVVCLSRYPLHEKYTFPDFSFQTAALSVIIDSPLGELSLCTVHLHANSEDVRLKELAVIMDYQTKYEKSIILGNFNAIARSDQHGDLTAEEFTYYDLTRSDVTDMIKKSYVDTIAHLNVDGMETHPTSGIPHPISKIPIRIDYVFVTPSLSDNIKNATVIKTQTAEKASDHYLLVVTFN